MEPGSRFYSYLYAVATVCTVGETVSEVRDDCAPPQVNQAQAPVVVPVRIFLLLQGSAAIHASCCVFAFAAPATHGHVRRCVLQGVVRVQCCWGGFSAALCCSDSQFQGHCTGSRRTRASPCQSVASSIKHYGPRPWQEHLIADTSLVIKSAALLLYVVISNVKVTHRRLTGQRNQALASCVESLTSLTRMAMNQ